ncbi:TPA_exp: hypothetical protein A8136_4233 [Trichophyton benhamiae CBS 112371]|nr:TPA_exp: hypothetical protein A8136_4233 [Trichophyton benhamiae CBS 112371]
MSSGVFDLRASRERGHAPACPQLHSKQLINQLCLYTPEKQDGFRCRCELAYRLS